MKVVLQDKFSKYEIKIWHYELNEGLIIVTFKDIKVLVECNENGYYIDILVCYNLIHNENLNFINEVMLKIIYEYCVANNGCQGFWFIENIIWSQCV